MASDPAWRPVRRTLWLLVGVAVAAEEVAVLSPDISPAVGLARAGVLLALAWLVGRWRPLRDGAGKPIPRPAFVLLLVLTLLPYPLEPLHALLTGPRPLELLLLDSMRNLCLGLAVLSAWP